MPKPSSKRISDLKKRIKLLKKKAIKIKKENDKIIEKSELGEVSSSRKTKRKRKSKAKKTITSVITKPFYQKAYDSMNDKAKDLYNRMHNPEYYNKEKVDPTELKDRLDFLEEYDAPNFLLYPSIREHETYKDTMKRFYVTFNKTVPSLFEINDYFHSAFNLMEDEIGYVMNTSFDKVKVYINAKITINDAAESDFYLASTTELIYNKNEIAEYLVGALQALQENYLNVVNSGQLLANVEYFDITVCKASNMFGNSYIKLPFKSRFLINIKNEDNKCFLWCVLAKIHFDEIKKNKSRVSNYKKFEDEINMQNISYPFKVKDLKKFHKLNPDISVTIYNLSNPEEL